MKYLSLSIAIGIFTAGSAFAQEAIPHFKNGGGVYTSPVNCDYLKGSKAICLVNQSEYDITTIGCEGHFFSGSSALPGGSIPGGGIDIIEFKSGTCYKHVEITWSNHEKRSFDNVNISDMTVWTIKGPRDAKHGGAD